MFDQSLTSPLFLVCFPLLVLIFFLAKHHTSRKASSPGLPKTYPLIGSFFSIFLNRNRRIQWTSDILQTSPSYTFTLHRPFGFRQVFTADPTVVQYILKARFPIYQKGDTFRSTLTDFLGNGIFNADGDDWKFQRQVSSHQFNTKSLKKFVETAVNIELSDRLIPLLCESSKKHSVLDFQDVLQRFAFDNICKIAFGYDPFYLLPSFPKSKFAEAYEDAVRISSQRFNAIVPMLWKVKRFLNVGSEKRLKIAVTEIRGYAKNIIAEKKKELREKNLLDSVDLLSRFLSSGHSDENFVTDIVISFILAGKDTTSAALTWFFWLISKYPEVEKKIQEEISEKSEAFDYDEVKEMVYVHAALCESMRLYPPVPVDTKEAVCDDVLPDGTTVKPGMRVSYHVYAMGRSEKLWGDDWAVFRPERWLEKEEGAAGGKWRFVARDNYEYPVFQAGPRICLGKEMAFLQMKRMVAGIMRRFRIVPVAGDGVEPKFVQHLTGKMEGGFLVRIEERREKRSL